MADSYAFGPFRLDVSAEILFRGAEPLPVGRRAIALLRTLIENTGVPVSKDVLIEAGWPGLAVEESNLTVQIASLRRVLGEEPGGERWIETLPRRGYRFVGPVAPEENTDEPAPPPGAPSLALPDKPSIAVLPFQNMSGDPEQEYFADGMVEEITTALSRIRGLFVSARNSSFTYKGRVVDIKQVGRELGVRYVLEGSVRKAGTRVRIAAQLIDGASGAHLWADNFDGTLDDVFELQDRVAASVAGVIEPTLRVAEYRRAVQRPTSDLTAYDLYLRAFAEMMTSEKQRLERAVDLVGQALERDPEYGSALALAATCQASLYVTNWATDLEAARHAGLDYARRALRVAGDDPHVLTRAAYTLGLFGDDIQVALALIDRALHLNPNFAWGWGRSGFLRMWAGEYSLGIKHCETSIRLNPRDETNCDAYLAIGMGYLFTRRLDDAAAMLRLALEERPSWAPTYRFLASCYAHMGRLEEASELVGRLRKITSVIIPNADQWRIREDREFFLAGLRLAAADGEHAEAVAAERRQLTVASCELLLGGRGGTDPEDLREIVRSYHGCVGDTARRHDAFVAHTHGNTASLFFGYPRAREDDAERAVHAALSLIAAVASLKSAIPLHARIGIATGQVVVGDSASLGGAPDVAGETPDIAARLHAIAAPDEVVVAESTRRLLGALFELRDLGVQNLEGVAEGGLAFKVVGPGSAGSRFEALHTDGLTSLVGREEELELLLRRWSRAKAGQGQVVLLSGEAGIGKSRLAAALSEAIAGEPHTRLRYFCSPQHIDSAFYPIIRHVERAAGFARDDAPQVKADKLDAFFALASISKSDAPLFAELLSVPNDGRHPTVDLAPQQKRQRTLDALTAHMEALSRRKPLLLIFEDAHWSDPTSLELLSHAVDRLKALPILLLVTFRPEFQAPWVGRPYVTSLTINRLTEREADAMIDHVVGDKSLPASVRRDINARTDGIPLFVEEMTKAILEAGSEAAAERTVAAVSSPEPAVPPSLHASLMARLDRLGPARETAQTGAAIGREFSHALLAAVARKPEAELSAALNRLVEAGLLFRQGVPPHATYLFKHALVRDAAYGTLLREPRRALHARIAETLETKFAEIADSRPELLARHCTEAGLIDKAAGLWGKAGQRSAERSALAEAVEQFTHALELIATLPSTPALRRDEIRFRAALITPLNHVKGYGAPEAKVTAERLLLLIEQAEARGETPEDPLMWFSALYGLTISSVAAFNGDVLRERAEQFSARAEKHGATVPIMVGHRLMGHALLYTGQIAAAQARYSQGLALYDPEEHRPFAMHFGHDISVVCLGFRSLAFWLLGYPEKALADVNCALKDAQEMGQAGTLMAALEYTAKIQAFCGHFAAANSLLEQLIALADQKAAPYWRAYGMVQQGCMLVATGDSSGAVRRLTSAMAALRSTGATVYAPRYQTNLARAHAGLGQLDDAWRCIGEATRAMQISKETWYAAEIDRIAGEIVLMAPAPDAAKAQDYFERALAIARQQQAKSWELRAAMSLARLWGEQGKRNEARDLLAPVHDWFTEGFDTLDLKGARRLLGELEHDPEKWVPVFGKDHAPRRS